jgi:hypothetical protein
VIFRFGLAAASCFASLAYFQPLVAEKIAGETIIAGTEARAATAEWMDSKVAQQSTRFVPAESLFMTDFAGGVSEWSTETFGSWRSTASWQLVRNGRPKWRAAGGTFKGGGNSVALVDDIRQSDVTVTTVLQVASVFNAGHHAGLVARFVNTDNYYELFVNIPDRSVYLVSVSDGIETRLASTAAGTIALATPIRLRLHCRDKLFTAFVNEQKVFSVRNDDHSWGKVGVLNAGGVTEFSYFGARLGGA